MHTTISKTAPPDPVYLCQFGGCEKQSEVSETVSQNRSDTVGELSTALAARSRPLLKAGKLQKYL